MWKTLRASTRRMPSKRELSSSKQLESVRRSLILVQVHGLREISCVSGETIVINRRSRSKLSLRIGESRRGNNVVKLIRSLSFTYHRRCTTNSSQSLSRPPFSSAIIFYSQHLSSFDDAPTSCPVLHCGYHWIPSSEEPHSALAIRRSEAEGTSELDYIYREGSRLTDLATGS